MRLVGILAGIARAVHHPAPAGLDPGHASSGEVRRGGETLLAAGGYSDVGGVGLVDGYGASVVGGADLPVGRRGAGVHAVKAECSRDGKDS